MIGHLGSKVSALLDGRLSETEEERAWQHVHACHFCRDLVEREGWVKTQLATLRPTDCAVSAGFKSSLLAAAMSGPEPVAPTPGLHRHRSVVVLGSSAAGVAIVGMAALSGVFTTTSVTDRRPTMTNVEQPVSQNSTRPVARTTSSATPTGPSTITPTPTAVVTTTPAARVSVRPISVASRAAE